MGFVHLNLKSIEDLDDGRVAVAFQNELTRAVMDCIDRPKDKGKRKVIIELELTPTLSDDDTVIECDGAEGEFKIKSTVPQRKSKTYAFRVNKQGQLAYSSNNPENTDQTTFEDVDPITGRVDRGPV